MPEVSSEALQYGDMSLTAVLGGAWGGCVFGCAVSVHEQCGGHETDNMLGKASGRLRGGPQRMRSVACRRHHECGLTFPALQRGQEPSVYALLRAYGDLRTIRISGSGLSSSDFTATAAVATNRVVEQSRNFQSQ